MKKQRQKTNAGRKFISLLLTAAMFLTLQGIPVLAETAGEAEETNAKTEEVKAVSAKTIMTMGWIPQSGAMCTSAVIPRRKSREMR